MKEIDFDYRHALSFITEEEIESYSKEVNIHHTKLHTNDVAVNDYKGWVDLPTNYDVGELERIKAAAKKIQMHSEIFLVIGVGGSYLGSKAAIEMLVPDFSRDNIQVKDDYPQIIFVGQNMSTTYIKSVKRALEGRDFSINVISKSGTTTEPAIALRIFKNILIKQYGDKAHERLFVTTDGNESGLLSLAQKREYEVFTIPDNIGGRYSVLTAVGLLPMAVKGINVDKVMFGAKEAYKELKDSSLEINEAYQYAVIRNILYRKGKTIELLVNYEPHMESFAKWWQQLFGESEGKNQQGIYPSYAVYPTDLHSIGQYIQDGRRDLFETTIKATKEKTDEYVHFDEKNLDRLNYLSGKTLEEINENIYQGTVLAHTDGGVPNITINISHLDEETYGYLVYFFLKSAAMSSYLFGVNPFDQPGVEAYKNNMFALLGKPGYESERLRLKRRLSEPLKTQ